MISDKKTVTLDDITVLNDIDKAALKKITRRIFDDISPGKNKAGQDSIILDRENEFISRLVFERDKPDTGTGRPLEDSIKGLGLSNAANKKLINGIKSRDYKRYHLRDIKYVSDLICDLEPAVQKKAIDVVIQNRKNLYQVNKEDIVLFLLGEENANQYYLDLWYSGVMRSLQNLLGKTGAGAGTASSLDPSQQKELKRKMRQLFKKASSVIDNL